MRRKTKEEFIAAAVSVHGDRYDYSLVEYVNNKVKVEILCPVHGSFWQSPSDHTNSKAGCKKCGIESMSKKATLGTNEFIEQAKLVHGDKYDYSLVNYIDTETKVKIICPIHDVFEQAPHSHLSQNGCKKCGIESRTKKATLELNEFIERAKEIHGDKYDYSLVNYVNNRVNVLIICPIHGVFKRTPNDHISKKSGCKSCGIKSRSQKATLDTEDFVKRAKAIHGDKYDYSLVEYVNVSTNIIIICPIHGLFEQTPSSHLHQESGCNTCGIKSRSQKATLDTEEFVKRAKAIHCNKYDYSQVEYVNSRSKVEIICHTHGVFEQRPYDHWNGHGCNDCERLILAKTLTLDTDEFIKRAKAIHGNKYDYSQVEYVNSRSKVNIICLKHGTFEQTPNHHLSGSCCRRCSELSYESYGERLISRALKSWNIQFKGQKIFDQCRDKKTLPFDFYAHVTTPTGPAYFLIEYDGRQHFIPIDYFGGPAALAATQRRDRIKNEFAARHSIPLIRISYKQKHKIRRVLRDAIIAHTGVDPLDQPAPAEHDHVKPVELVPEDYRQGRLFG